MNLKIDQEHRDEIEKILTEYESSVLGMPALPDTMQAPSYLSMSLEEIRRKSPDELAEASFEITQYAIYVQRVINKLRAWERWGKSKLDEIASFLIQDLPPNLGYNERELIARNKHELCRKLNKFLREIRMKIDRLYDVPNNLFRLNDSVREIKFAALKREKNQ